ncbi:MAG TPA: ABC transporter permease subunit [Mobilitalea sp.]|nr:ABC transporter permease subunit [Mobilitalea sp.]
MNLYSSECYKIITKRSFLVVLFVAAAINLFLCLRSSGDEIIDAGENKQLYAKLRQLSDESEIRNYLVNRQEESRDNYQSMYLYETTLLQLDRIITYEEFLEQVESRAGQVSILSIFARENSFTYRSIQKTPKAYIPLKGNTPELVNSQGMLFATNREFTDILAILLLLMAASLLVLNEKEAGLFALLRPTRRGRSSLLLAKMLALFTFSALIYILFYGMNFIASWKLYGGTSLTAWLQSVEGFMGSVLPVSIGGYLILFSLTKILTYYLIAALFVLLCIIGRNTLFVYGAAFAYYLLSYLIYLKIPGSSYLSLLKYFNVSCMLHTNTIYQNYLDVNVLGYPVSILWVCFFLLIPMGVILTISNLIIFSRQKNVIFHNLNIFSQAGILRRFSHRVRASLLYYESYKIMATYKAGIILAIAMIISIYQSASYRMPYIPNDNLYRYYMQQVEGELTDKTYAFLSEEQLRYDNLKKQLEVIREEYRSGRLNQASYQYLENTTAQDLKSEIGYQMFVGRVRAIEPYYIDTEGIKPWLLYDTGYNQLLGIMPNSNLSAAHILFLFCLILCVAPVYAIENQYGGCRLFGTTRKGRIPSFFARLLTGTILTMILYAIIYIPCIFNILENYTYAGLGAPIQSLDTFRFFPWKMTIGGILVLSNVIRLICSLLCMVTIMCISYYSKSTASTLAINFGIILLPTVIFLLGGSFMDRILWNPYLYSHIVLRDNRSSGDKIMICVNTVLCLGGITALFRKTYLNIRGIYR